MKDKQKGSGCLHRFPYLNERCMLSCGPVALWMAGYYWGEFDLQKDLAFHSFRCYLL